MNDGFAFAALLAQRVGMTGAPRESTPEYYVSRGARPGLALRLEALRCGQLSAADLVPSLRPGPQASMLSDASPRVRAVVGSLLAPGERRRFAHRDAHRGPLPAPRRGYEAPPGLASALARWRSDSEHVQCCVQERSELDDEERAWSES